MKKIIYTLVLFISFFTITYAYTEIDLDDFDILMTELGYETSNINNGMMASSKSEPLYIESYEYNSYEKVDDAINKLKKLSDVSDLSLKEHNVITSYNVDNTQKDNYSFIKFDYIEEGLSLHKYYYIFRINKSLVVGCGIFDKRDKIDTIVEKLISDKVTDDINNIYDWQGEEEDTQLPQNYVDKKENKKKYLLIVLILLFVLILVIGVIFLIVKRNKAKKNDVL